MSVALKLARGLELPIEVVTEASAIVATRGAGKSSASAVIVEEAFALGVQTVIFDRTGVYWGLRSNAQGSGPGLGIYVLGGPHGDAPLEAHAGPLIADLVVDAGHSFVLDLSDFSKGSAIKFAASFLERLYDRKARARSTTLLVMDEAHFYAPQTPRGGFKGDSARLMGAMEDVVGLGRSRGLGVILTTQRTQALNKAILDLIETLFVMRMLSPRARDAVQDWIREKHEDDREGVIATLESLPTGTAWVWSPLRGVLQKAALRRIRTFDSYDNPKPGEVRIEPQARSELDLDALGEQIRATMERAKADDPAELRRRIRELEADLDKKSKPVEPEVVREPFVPPAVSDAMRQIIEAADGHEEAFQATMRVWREQADRAMAVLREQAARPVLRPSSGRNDWTGRGSPPSRRESSASASGPAVQTNGDAPERGVPEKVRQKILDALGWWISAGVTPATRLQVALVAGYHPRTPSFTKALAELQAEGAVIYPQAGLVELMKLELATPPRNVPRTDEQLQEMILAQVSDLRGRVLRVVLDQAPTPVARVDVARELGYHPRTPSFTKAIAGLKALGLVSFPRPGLIAAEPVMFVRSVA